jgi:hypothetical protein
MRILVLLLCAVGLYGQSIPMGSVGPFGGDPCPAPVLEMSVGSGSATWTGATSGTCSLTGTTIQEDPAMSGTYVLDLDGGNDDWQCGPDADGLTTLTVMAWLRMDAYEAGGAGQATEIVGKMATGGSGSVSWLVRVGSAATGNIRLMMSNTSAAFDSFASDTASWDAFVGLSTYTHFAGKMSNCASMACDSPQLYIDGSPVTTTQIADNAGSLRDDSTYTVRGGTLGNSANDFDGRITGLRIYDEAVSDACVASIFAAGRP